jgi:hypothetical protein
VVADGAKDLDIAFRLLGQRTAVKKKKKNKLNQKHK